MPLLIFARASSPFSIDSSIEVCDFVFPFTATNSSHRRRATSRELNTLTSTTQRRAKSPPVLQKPQRSTVQQSQHMPTMILSKIHHQRKVRQTRMTRERMTSRGRIAKRSEGGPRQLHHERLLTWRINTGSKSEV